MKKYIAPELKLENYYNGAFVIMSNEPWQDGWDDGKDDIF